MSGLAAENFVPSLDPFLSLISISGQGDDFPPLFMEPSESAPALFSGSVPVLPSARASLADPVVKTSSPAAAQAASTCTPLFGLALSFGLFAEQSKSTPALFSGLALVLPSARIHLAYPVVKTPFSAAAQASSILISSFGLALSSGLFAE